MDIITPSWFDVPGFKWEDLPVNARIAARWVHAGAKVFPCYHHVFVDERGNIHDVKTPKTPNGFKDASDNLLAVLVWWTQNPEDLVGVSCEDLLLVIDIDMDSDKDEPVDGWASLNNAGLSVPEGFMILTPRGGNHAYCRPPAGTAANSVKNLRLEDGTVLHGVDRRALGGYVIGWVEDGIPDSIEDLPLAPIEYCHVYSGHSKGVEYTKTTEEWLVTIGAGEPTGRMKKAEKKIPRGKFGHNEMRDLQRHIIGLAAEGISGGALILEELRSAYLRPPYDTLGWEADFNAALAGGIAQFGGLTEAEDSGGLRSKAIRAVALANEKYDFFPTNDGDLLARPKNGPMVALSVDGNKDFRSQLMAQFYEASGGTQSLSDTAYREAVGIILGSHLAEPKVEAHLRVALDGEDIIVDLGDATGHCIKVTPEGWSVEAEPPVLFRRTVLTGPLPVPVRGGNLREFFNLLNIPQEKKAVYLAFLVCFFFPDIAHPVLAAFGPQGSGKTKLTEFTHLLLDNSPVLGRKLPRDLKEWIVAAQASYLINLDNVSRLSHEMSDALSRAVTGEADVHRSLYTNKDLEIFRFRRVMLLNGIDVLGIREDLAERLLVIDMPVIAPGKRLTEAGIKAAATAMMPDVFGALLDVLVEVMRVLPHIHVEELPRMADFAKILHAIDTIYPGMNAVEEYEIGVEEYASNLVKQHPVLSAIAGAIVEPWEGTSSELLELIGPKYPALDDPAGLWPKTPAHMTSLLARSGPTFDKIGWRVEDLGSRNKQRTRRWRITPPQPEADFSTSSPNPHEDEVSGG